MSVLLKTKGITKSYSGITVLSGIDFELRSGEVHAIVGENGAGKSTLIKILAGVVQPDTGGELYFEGALIPRMTVQKSRTLGISVIFQDISLFPHFTVAENICCGLKRSGLHKKNEANALAKEVLGSIGASLDYDALLGDISVGKQQLTAIARAVACKSKVIIMDEPTSTLSSSEVDMLYNVVKKLKQDGVGIIYISHKFDEVFALADKVTVLRDGELIKTDDISAFDQTSLINLMVGRELRFTPCHMQGEPGEILFAVKNITSRPYFQDISFEVRRNEVLGITGLVGAGRSEMAQAIFGLLPLEAGVIELAGKQLKHKSAAKAIANGICYLPEDRRQEGLFMKKSMETNISVGSLKKVLTKMGLISPKKESETTYKYIESLQIRPALPKLNAENLSGGNQQKVLTARWMNADPKVLIVDEVTNGVDVGVKAEIHRLIRSLASSGVAVIMISSDLPEVLAVSDRILVMREGRAVQVMDVINATQENILEKGLLG